MIGAIIGDIIGSRFEMVNWAQDKTFENYRKFNLFEKTCRPTDDTVLSCAVAKTLMGQGSYAENYKKFGRTYPNAGYGGSFISWLDSESLEGYNSFGNGSAMRVSPIGWFHNVDEAMLGMLPTVLEAELSALPTHNHLEGIKGAQAIALCIYMARAGINKDRIKTFTENEYGYDLSRTLDQIRPTYDFSATCQDTVPQAITAFLESENFEDCIRKAISLGGDSDTIAAMAGSIGEAFYGIDSNLYNQAYSILDAKHPELYLIVKEWENFIHERRINGYV